MTFGFMDADRRAGLARKVAGPLLELLERVVCPVCGVDDTTAPVFGKGGLDFVRCYGCGLLHQNPQLLPEVQTVLYRRSDAGRERVQARERGWNVEVKYGPGLEALGEPGRLLDVGCGTGQFLDLAAERGWGVDGVEPGPAIVAAEAAGHYVRSDISSAGDAVYDAVTLWGVLEHLADPGEMLGEVHRLLKPGGRALFFVPNGDSLILRLMRGANSTVSWQHLWYFGPGQLRKLLVKHGFEVEREFTVLPQFAEVRHWLRYGQPYEELEVEDGFDLPVLEDWITRSKLGFKLITIGRKV